MNDFEARGAREEDILGHYSKMRLDEELIVNQSVNGMAIVLGSY